MPRRWLLSQQNRILILIDSRILFEPMSVICGTFCYIGTLFEPMSVRFCMLLCMSCFDDMWCMCDTIDFMLWVFDPSRLLVVRVGNLNELSSR